MARETKVIPDLYFPDEDQELQTSSVEGKGGHDQGGGLGRKTVDLTPEGFIPIHKLTLKDLPEPIRTEDFLEYILAVSTLVVRVNNNGLSDLRPDDDQFKRAKQKSLTGSGWMLGSNDVAIITNRHVLFNEEELWKSTFDVFYDYHHGDTDDAEKLFKRCVRSNGKLFHGKFSKDDIVHASYTVKDIMKVHIKDHCLDKTAMAKHQIKLESYLDRVRNKPIVACLISHPLGQPKHVSFGEMVNYDMPSRTIHHTAPSKPGSSGGRVIVFSKFFLEQTIVHVGTELLGGKKYKYARLHSDGMSYSFSDFFHSLSTLTEKGDKTGGEQEITVEEICRRASESVEITSLAAFVPIFGAFLLRVAEARLKGLDTSVLTPCKVLPTDEPLTSCEVKQSVKKVIERIAQILPSITPFPSSSLGDAATLLSLLESQGPCYCQSIVKMMERGVQMEDGTVTECFLSPYTAAAKMSSDFDVTWPWLKGRMSDLDKFDATEGCILRECLKLADEDIFPVMLLLMIARGNVEVKHLHLQSSDACSTMMDRDYENQGKTVHEQSKQEPRLEQNTEKRHSETQHSPTVTEQKGSSSAAEVERDWHRLTADVILVVAPLLGLICPCFATTLGSKHQNVTSEQQEESEDISKLYSGCLAVSEHARQHEWQVHPDTEHCEHDNNGNWCKCGRPGASDIFQALNNLEVCSCFQLRMNYETSVKKMDDLCDLTQELENKNSTSCFIRFIEWIQQYASDKSIPPATVVLTALDRDSFPRGRHSFMLFLASREVFLYNSCLLAKYISKRLLTWYFAFPVSVFGRPGNWPGNVTPPKVQRTAWRLIQDAIMASDFPPAVLAALEKDAKRREKLIDLYVDMKQLKWQGRIQPHLFPWYLAKATREKENHVQSVFPFDGSTHYFVWYAAFLVCPKILTSRCSLSPQHYPKLDLLALLQPERCMT